MSMPGKQARVLCPVCAEPMPPEETECANCGAFVIDEAVVRLSRAFGLDREKALKPFEAGFRHTKQLRDRDPNGILEKGEVGLLFICTNCGGFVAAGDTKCPRCAAEFEAEPEPPGVEEDILDLVLCPTCGADNDPELEECEICGTALRGTKEPSPVAAEASLPIPSRPASPLPKQQPVDQTRPAPAPEIEARLVPRDRPATPASAKIRGRAEAPSRIPRKNARPPAEKTRVRITAETAGGLVLAASTSLLLAGALNQPLVSAGIAAFLIGFGAYLSWDYVRAARAPPPRFDALFLGTGTVLTVSALLLRGLPIDASTAVAPPVPRGLPFSRATRGLVRRPHRILLAISSAIPIIGQAIPTGAAPAYAMSLPWNVGLPAAMPWPAALAAAEILRRKSASSLRRQLIRAERDMGRKDYEQSLAEYDRAIATARPGVTGAEIPWYGKGATLILLGRYDEALRAIDTALDINPHNEVAWLNKGNAFTKLGRLVDALRCFNAAIKVNPTYEVAW